MQKNSFIAVFIYCDYHYDHISPEIIDIDINEKTGIKKISLSMTETLDTQYNFKDIDSVIIDAHSNITGDIKVRKIFQVEFVSYHQRYAVTDGKWKNETSIISLEFDIKNMDIYQDSDIQTLESYIRDRKLTNLIE